MLPVDKFRNYKPSEIDKYYDEVPKIRLADLEWKNNHKPKISVLISTYNRQAQLQRALECYARQTFKDFEILLNDDGSTQNIKGIVDPFEPFLHIQYFRSPRVQWVSCPSKAYNMMYEYAQGKIIVVAHPEMMLSFDALQFIYDVLKKGKTSELITYVIDTPKYDGKSPWKWVSLRPNFFDSVTYTQIDAVNWHNDLEAFHDLPNWGFVTGFAGRQNYKHAVVPGYPWWFVGAALKECPIWMDTPITEGHANIDMFWCYYRKKYKFLDVVPDKVMCYHQPHQVSAVAPEGEQSSIIPASEGAKCVYNW